MVRGRSYQSVNRTAFQLPSYTFYEPPFSVQRLVNIYPDKLGGQDQKNYVFRRCLGYDFWLGFNQGNILAHHVFKNVLYIATKTNLIKCQKDKSFVVIGTYAGAENIQIKNTASELVLRIDAAIHTHTTNDADSLVQVTDADLQSSKNIAIINNYVFSVIDDDSGQFQWSDFNDPDSFGALNFATAEYRADALNAVIDHRNEFLLFGDTTVEFWAVVGGSNVVAPRNYASNIGCTEINTIRKIKDNLFFVGIDPLNNEKSVYVLNGYNPSDIASKHIKKELSNIDISEAYAYTHFENGYDFYTVVVPEKISFSYIVQLDTWIERKSWDSFKGEYKKDVKIFDSFSFNNLTLIYEKNIGSLFFLSGNKEYLNDMPWAIVTPFKVDKPYNQSISEVELDIESGAGNVAMSFSRDNGLTWSIEDWKETPVIGQKSLPLLWRRLGNHQRVTFRFRGFGNANITGGYVGI